MAPFLLRDVEKIQRCVIAAWDIFPTRDPFQTSLPGELSILDDPPVPLQTAPTRRAKGPGTGRAPEGGVNQSVGVRNGTVFVIIYVSLMFCYVNSRPASTQPNGRR